MIRFLSFATCVLFATSAVAGQDAYGNAIFHPVHAEHGMVASEQKIASAVGTNILRQGGNAVDAAVATAFALAVVLPNAGNLGGGGFMVLHDEKDDKDVSIDFRESAPAAATRDMYLDDKGEVIKDRSLFTPLAVGIPGTVKGMEYALSHYGTMSWKQVITPSIELAENGFTVSEQLASMLQGEKEHLTKWDSSRAIFFKDGEPLKEGDLLVQKDLAKTLRVIAENGSSAFYTGEIGDKIVAEIQKDGGIITKDDLKNYQVHERPPVMGVYHEYKIISMPPPSSGGTHIIEILNILSHFPLKDYGAGSADAIHIMAEAMKFAYADRSLYLGDPDFVKVPVKGLTSRVYADDIAKKISLDKVTPSSEIKPGNPGPYESNDTTHYSVIDKDGNAVAVTYTLNWDFGSGLVAGGTGILLNDEMDDFAAKAGVPNAFGVTGNDANAVGPNKRPLSSMSPTIVLKDGRLAFVTGSPGGSRIITTTLETIVNMVDFGMNPAEAAVAPRIHHQWLPDELRVEKGISPDTIRILKAQGYKVSVQPTMGRVQIIEVKDNGLYGYSDPRNPDGAAIGY